MITATANRFVFVLTATRSACGTFNIDAGDLRTANGSALMSTSQPASVLEGTISSVMEAMASAGWIR